MRINIDQIVVGERLRKIDKNAVDEIAESFDEIEMLHPITVYREGDKKSRGPTSKFHLAAGLHRLEAAKKLGWTVIEVDLCLEADAILVEIEENLRRKNLTRKQLADMRVKRVAILAERANGELSSPLAKNPGTPKTPETEAIKDTAEATGVSKRLVRADVRRKKKILPEVWEQLPDDTKEADMDILASIPQEHQQQALDRVKTIPDETFKTAKEFIVPDEDEHQKAIQADLKGLRLAWNKYKSPEARKQFLNEIAGWDDE